MDVNLSTEVINLIYSKYSYFFCPINTQARIHVKAKEKTTDNM
jgi:hypothetical protein